MKNYSVYGERIRVYRMRRKISQEALAGQVGLPETALSRIEHGARKVTLEEAVRLAEVLRISLAQLAGLDDSPLRDETVKRSAAICAPLTHAICSTITFFSPHRLQYNRP